jgi:hypothetical protein
MTRSPVSVMNAVTRCPSWSVKVNCAPGCGADMFIPVRDCAIEQALIPHSEVRVVDDVLGHLGLLAVSPTSYATNRYESSGIARNPCQLTEYGQRIGGQSWLFSMCLEVVLNWVA